MRNIKIVLEYDGSRYLGWQRLKDSDRTIQGKIESVISKMVGEDIEITGSGRTDSGVHAYYQVANFKIDSTLNTKEIQEYINHYLPNDIVIRDIEEVDDRFHSRYNVKSKTYQYKIWIGNYQSPFMRKYSWYVADDLNIEIMKKASEFFMGTHDFIGFSSLKRYKKSTTRTISRIDFNQEDDILSIEIQGDGFLHNMVRIIVGTLVQIGSGRLDKDVIMDVLENKIRADAGITAPPHGLFLKNVEY